jgi:hypothetical protein
MPIISNQISLIGATFMLILGFIGIISQSRKTQEKRIGVVFAASWGALLLSILVILSNDAFFQLIIRELAKIQGS